ncbi:MAG TPA: hypothetical protein VGC13_23905 [Longimicrobium sp.]|jgi:hypothetical protein|uniref:hypothetical protein n=1 Tax=Longimicrobium sp. TaxID=2029185 RepID=UPI002EDA3BE3
MSRNRIRARRWAAAAAVLALLGGCDNTLQTQTETPILAPGVHAVVVVPPAAPGSPTEVQLHLRREGVVTPIASYQGELRYDASLLTVQGGAFPAGVMGAWNEVEPGRVRFAAAAPDGLGGSLALTLRATPRGEIGESAFQVRMQELVGAAAFEDLTPRFVDRAHPLFSTTPLHD